MQQAHRALVRGQRASRPFFVQGMRGEAVVPPDARADGAKEGELPRMRKDDRQIDGRGPNGDWVKHTRNSAWERHGHNRLIRRKVRMFRWIDLLHEERAATLALYERI